jgi:hypothetical protein
VDGLDRQPPREALAEVAHHISEIIASGSDNRERLSSRPDQRHRGSNQDESQVRTSKEEVVLPIRRLGCKTAEHSGTVRIPAGETGPAGDYSTIFWYTTTDHMFGTDPMTVGGLPGELIDYDRRPPPRRQALQRMNLVTPH